MPREYIIYCDESIEKGEYYSDFYGGLLVSSSRLDAVRVTLEARKTELHLHREVKWGKVTANYLEKYITLMDTFFDLIGAGQVKVRIMFRQTAYEPQNLTDYSKQHGYFLLYYQFIKHAFGFQYCNGDTEEPVYLRLFFDELPDSKTKAELFKNHIYALQSLPTFTSANVRIRRRDIVEIDSKGHVLLQCLDVVLGAMAFRLNDLHKKTDPATGKRGNRTKAKEKLYKHILRKIRLIYPGFNIGVSTGTANGLQERWEHSYRHWRFIPRDFRINDTKFK